jgi:integrase
MLLRGRVWYGRLFERGRERKFSLGWDYEEACRKWREIKSGGTVPVRATVEEGARRWLETDVQARRNQKGRGIAAARVRMYLVPFMGWKVISKVTVLVGRSPFPKGLLPRIPEREPDRLSDEEVAIAESLPGLLGFTVRLGLATGLRWGEMARALTQDIRRDVMTVKQTKSGRIRRVPLPPEILAELRGRVGKLIPYGKKSVGSFNRDVRLKTEIVGFHAHQLRHTFACQYLEAGGSLPVLQQLLGHAEIKTTQRYGRLSDYHVLEEATRVHAAAQTVPITVPAAVQGLRKS